MVVKASSGTRPMFAVRASPTVASLRAPFVRSARRVHGERSLTGNALRDATVCSRQFPMVWNAGRLPPFRHTAQFHDDQSLQIHEKLGPNRNQTGAL